jgi:hypothetical protein
LDLWFARWHWFQRERSDHWWGYNVAGGDVGDRPLSLEEKRLRVRMVPWLLQRLWLWDASEMLRQRFCEEDVPRQRPHQEVWLQRVHAIPRFIVPTILHVWPWLHNRCYAPWSVQLLFRSRLQRRKATWKWDG